MDYKKEEIKQGITFHKINTNKFKRRQLKAVATSTMMVKMAMSCLLTASTCPLSLA